jgi:hypothetical protein
MHNWIYPPEPGEVLQQDGDEAWEQMTRAAKRETLNELSKEELIEMFINTEEDYRITRYQRDRLNEMIDDYLKRTSKI